MINHARTLLMNIDGDGYGGTLGDEYIPPSFASVDLPSYLNALRVYLFGTDPSRHFLNYRVQQCMAILHASPLVEFVTDLDSRITYDVNNEQLFARSNYELTDTDYLFFIDTLGAPDVTGRSYHKWKIRRLNATTIQVERQSPVAEVKIYEYTITDGLSNIIPLPGSEASFRFSDMLPTGFDQRIEGYARPERDLGEILANLLNAGRPYMLQLFSVGTTRGSTEPFKTFYNLWRNQPELPYKLGAVLLAMIYQTEARRTQDG